MIQYTVDSLSAESLLTEMFRQNRCRHLFKISHFIYRNSTADNFFHIWIRNIWNIPHLIAGFFHLIPLIHLRDDFFCMSKETDKFLIGLAFLGHRIICSNFHIRQITKQFILCIKTDFSRINLWSFCITLIWFQLFITFLKFFCPMITKLLRITVPVDYLIRIMEIKILFPQNPCQKIRYIFCTHTQTEPQ